MTLPEAERQGDQSSTGSLQPEVVQEEVKKAVQVALQGRDNRMNELQTENAELKQLLMTMIEANQDSEGAGADQGLLLTWPAPKSKSLTLKPSSARARSGFRTPRNISRCITFGPSCTTGNCTNIRHSHRPCRRRRCIHHPHIILTCRSRARRTRPAHRNVWKLAILKWTTNSHPVRQNLAFSHSSIPCRTTIQRRPTGSTRLHTTVGRCHTRQKALPCTTLRGLGAHNLWSFESRVVGIHRIHPWILWWLGQSSGFHGVRI